MKLTLTPGTRFVIRLDENGDMVVDVLRERDGEWVEFGTACAPQEVPQVIEVKAKVD